MENATATKGNRCGGDIMATVFDSVSIKGMKKSDLEQLEKIFNDFEREDIYWGRKDYFNQRQIRLGLWIRGINKLLNDNDARIAND